MTYSGFWDNEGCNLILFCIIQYDGLIEPPKKKRPLNYWFKGSRDCILRQHLGVVRTLSWLSGLLPGWRKRHREKIMSTQPDSSAPSSHDGPKVRIKEIDCNSCQQQQQKPHCQRGGEYSERVCLPEGHMPHASSGCRGGKLGKTIARFFLLKAPPGFPPPDHSFFLFVVL